MEETGGGVVSGEEERGLGMLVGFTRHGSVLLVHMSLFFIFFCGLFLNGVTTATVVQSFLSDTALTMAKAVSRQGCPPLT